jgi:hypothetical protein
MNDHMQKKIISFEDEWLSVKAQNPQLLLRLHRVAEDVNLYNHRKKSLWLIDLPEPYESMISILISRSPNTKC